MEIHNYRALRQVKLAGLEPMTVFLGPNGSGKSTLFDVFSFLRECLTDVQGIRRAWDKRGRFKELRSRNSEQPIKITLKYREIPTGIHKSPIITYSIEIDEDRDGPFVNEEYLSWRRGASGKPFRFLQMKKGSGEVVSGEEPDETAKREPVELKSREVVAVSSLGQFKSHPRVSALLGFITGWYVSFLTADATRSRSEAGPQEHLSDKGDNLANVMQYLSERYGSTLDTILKKLGNRVPRLENVSSKIMDDGSLLLQIKDAPFDKPVLAKYASDGTLKMLAYLIVLNDPAPPPFVGIEEPENHLHPRLLPGLAEECRIASEHSQFLVTTHSPFFINGLRAKELWVLYRDSAGFTQAQRASEMASITGYMDAGASLGDLWLEGRFDCGDPLVNAGAPVRQ
jgi:predicted ATPase